MAKIISSLYNGKIELTMDTLVHRYSVNGKHVPGVTTIGGVVAKPGLVFWAANCAADHWMINIVPGKSYDEVELDLIYRDSKKAHTKFKEDAASVGTITHKWVQNYIEGKDPGEPVNDVVKGSVQRFLDWVHQNDVKFLLSEQPCYSIKNEYAGTIDFICLINGKLYLGDLKTNNTLYKNSMGSQCAGYMMARNEEYPKEKYAGFVVCRVGKEDAEFEEWMCENQEYIELFKDNFLNTLKLFTTESLIKGIK